MSKRHPGMDPATRYRLSEYGKCMKQMHRPSYLIWRERNCLPLRAIDGLADIWKQFDKFKKMTSRGHHFYRREAHRDLYIEIEDFLRDAIQVLSLSASDEREPLRRQRRSFLEVMGLIKPPRNVNQLATEGERLPLRIQGFIDGEWKPKQGTKRFLEDRCMPLIEDVIDALKKKTPA